MNAASATPPPLRSAARILFGLGILAVLMLSFGRKNYPNLHNVLDTGICVVSGMLAWFLRDMAGRVNHPVLKGIGISFAVTSLLELLHVLCTVEWTGALAPIATASNLWRPATWPPPAYLLPIGIACSFRFTRLDGRRELLFSALLLGLGAGLLVVFGWWPRYNAPGLLAISRPSLLLVPLMWAILGWRCWRLRAEDEFLPMLALMSLALGLAHTPMLYSLTPHDTQATVAHMGKLGGYLVLLVLVMKRASCDMRARLQAERELVQLKEELERRVLERTAQLESANHAAQREIAMRWQADHKLRESEALHRTLVETAVEGIITIDESGIIQSFNASAERIFGCSNAEAVGRNVSRLMPQPHQGEHDAYIANYLGTGARKIIGVRREVQGLRNDGAVFPIELAVSETLLGERRIFTGFVRDITERKRAEAEIQRLNQDLERRVAERTVELMTTNQELGKFSYTVAHDLRAPLRAIGGYSAMLAERYQDRKLDPEGKRFLDVIQSEAQRMGQLIDGLLVFTRLARQPLQSAELDMGQLARSVVDELIASLNGPPPVIEVAPLPPSQGDPTWIRQVFANLLSNSVKFTRHRERALIQVGSRRDPGQTVYFIRDNGVGFDPKFSGKVFGLFHRLHRDDEFEGVGVGLAMVHRIVRRHGGWVWADAQPDQGATFYFTLPSPENVHTSPP